MALIHSLEKSGNFLFKNRGQMPIILFIGALPAVYTSNYAFIVKNETFHTFIALLAFCTTFLGLLIRAITVGSSSKNTSGRNTSAGQIADDLNTSGMYSIVRHPLYLGNYFMWIGIVIFIYNIWFFLLVSLAFWLYYERIMFAEEQYLSRKFGNKYLNWSSKTPAVIPAFKNFVKSEIKFSWITIIRREYGGLSASVLSFLFVYFLREIFHFKTFCLSKFVWFYVPISIFALLFSFVLRLIKHKTTLLEEKDRS